jgi:phospholipase/carboxylesterase
MARSANIVQNQALQPGILIISFRAMIVALAISASAIARSGAQANQEPAPATQPSVPTPLGPGHHELKLDNARDGTLYVPQRYRAATPAPLIVWLHGAGGSGQVSATLASLADEFGFVVLAPDSREWTWDAILGVWGPDVDFIQIALRYTLARCAIDRNRIWLAGFSDGASYALSLGISYGNVFTRIFAGSPGVMQPIEVNGKPAIFISHGTDDTTMPIDVTSRTFVSRLKALGYDVAYREYDGGHRLPPDVFREAIAWLNK